MPTMKTFRGVLVCDIATGQMRLVEQHEDAGPWEVSVDVTIKVNSSDDVRGLLIAEVTIPPLAIEQISGNPQETAGGE